MKNWKFKVLLFPLTLVMVTLAQKPNIVFFLVDDQGYNDVGFNGSKDYKTPEIDKLATQGAILTSFYVQNVCSPTRAAFLTGRYPLKTGVFKIINYTKPWDLPVKEKLLSEGLREAGYQTAICGKWHLGEDRPELRPTKRGFDLQYGLLGGAINSFDLTSSHLGNTLQRDWWRNDIASDDKGYATELLADEAVSIIQKKPANKPLFLYVPFNAVHTPHQAPDSLQAPYAKLTAKRKATGGMTSGVDEAIGRIVAAIEAKGLTSNTLFIYSSDNGGTSFNNDSNNDPLRGGKSEIYEGGVRACAFVTWAGKIPAGVKIDEPMHIIDWYPTLLKLAGATVSQPLPIDGLDIWPVLTAGAPTPHTEILLLGSDNGQRAIRMGNWKLLINPVDMEMKNTPGGLTSDPMELYDLSKDIEEIHNLAKQEPQRTKQMLDRMNSFFVNVVNPSDFYLPGEKVVTTINNFDQKSKSKMGTYQTGDRFSRFNSYHYEIYNALGSKLESTYQNQLIE